MKRKDIDVDDLMYSAQNKFWRNLGWITARALRDIPEEYHDELLMRLQDAASVYGTDYGDRLKILKGK